ncbi:MAG: PQQ-binding-like beta-propeller repeat protein [Pseudobdellovibrionaceae bacterium]
MATLKWTPMSIFAALVVLVTVLGLRQNPTLLTSDYLFPRYATMVGQCIVLQDPDQNPASSLESAISVYRQNDSRQAIFSVPHFNFTIKKIWRSADPVNLGVHSASKASAIIHKDSVFVGGDNSWFYSYDKKNGNLNWKFYTADSTRGIHSTAVAEGDFVYVGSYRGSIYKIHQKSGKIVWSRIVGQTIGASPLIVGDQLIIAVETMKPGGYLISMHKDTCELQWRSTDLGEQAHSSPAYDPQTGLLVLGANNSTYQAFDVKTGHRVWKTHIQGHIKSTPWVDEGHSYITSWGNEIFKVDHKTGALAWRAELENKSQVSPALSKKHGVVFVADSGGKMYGLSESTGDILWTQESDLKFQISSPVVLKTPQDEKFLFFCQKAKVCLINHKGKIEKTWPVDGFFTGSLFLIDVDPGEGTSKLPMAFNEGHLVQYELQFSK